MCVLVLVPYWQLHWWFHLCFLQSEVKDLNDAKLNQHCFSSSRTKTAVFYTQSIGLKCHISHFIPYISALNRCDGRSQYHLVGGGTKCIYVSELDVDDGFSWFQARAICQDDGGDLLTLNSQAVRTVLFHLWKILGTCK